MTSRSQDIEAHLDKRLADRERQPQKQHYEQITDGTDGAEQKLESLTNDCAATQTRRRASGKPRAAAVSELTAAPDAAGEVAVEIAGIDAVASRKALTPTSWALIVSLSAVAC